MPQTTYRDYWAIIIKEARGKASNKVSLRWRIASIAISFFGVIAGSALMGNDIGKTLVSGLYGGLIGTLVWLTVWAVFSLWYRAQEPVLEHNQQERMIEEQRKTISSFEKKLSNKKIVIYDDGDSIKQKDNSDIELRFAIYNDSSLPMENWYALVEEVKYCEKGDKNEPTDFPKNQFWLVWSGNPPTGRREKPIPPHDYAQIAIAETTVNFDAFKLTTLDPNKVRLQKTGYYLVTIKIGGTFGGVGVTKRIQISLLYEGKKKLKKIPSHTDLSDEL